MHFQRARRGWEALPEGQEGVRGSPGEVEGCGGHPSVQGWEGSAGPLEGQEGWKALPEIRKGSGEIGIPPRRAGIIGRPYRRGVKVCEGSRGPPGGT